MAEHCIPAQCRYDTVHPSLKRCNTEYSKIMHMEYSISQYNSGVVQYIPVHSKGMVHRKGMVDVKGMVVRWVEKTDFLKLILAIRFFNVG